MMQKLFHYASPQNFYPLAGKLWPAFALLATGLTVWGLWLGMFVAPTDFQQGEGYRIIFVHVPASWMSMVIYLAMAFWALLGLTFNTRLSGMMGRALDGCTLGQAHVGCLVGLGRALDVRVNFVFLVPRLHRIDECHR